MKRPKSETWLWWIVSGMCLLWLGTPFLNLTVAGGDFAKAGQLGDMYGLVNAGFSGLGAVGVVVALRIQTRELRAVIDEREKNSQYQKRLLTVGLHTEWHSERLSRARREALLAIDRTCTKQGHGLTWWESPKASDEDEKLRSKYGYSVISLVGYFERIAELSEAGIIERDLISQLMGSELASMSTETLDPLAAVESNPQIALKLTRVSEFMKALDDEILAKAPAP